MDDANAASQALAIEDYALIGDCQSGALVGRNGSIDWLCWPRFDSPACFAALLGTTDHGRWLIAPDVTTGSGLAASAQRSYRGDTLILETIFDTEQGCVALIDFMPIGCHCSSIVRRIEGRRGRVAMKMHLKLRFDYGSSTPWVTKLEDGTGISAIVGPNQVVLRTQVELEGADQSTIAAFDVAAGESVDFVLSWGESHLPVAAPVDAGKTLASTEAFWSEWSGRCRYTGRWRKPVLRSLLTLKALTYAPTGGVVAALTTSLPEQLGGPRNWDYRYCWLRDAALTLLALMEGGYTEEAIAWREWLQRAIAGNPDEMQIMYSISGERRLVEWTPTWLPGYQGAAPVRIGNAASEQLQLDIFGEVAWAMHHARSMDMPEPKLGWSVQVQFMHHLAQIWSEPDDGIWEVRGGRKQFTHSKVMSWVAFDRAIRDAERCGYEAPLDEWRAVRDKIHETVCAQGFDADKDSFVQSFGSTELDASLLLIPITGFLPIDDPRVAGTIAAVERELLVDGFVLRYRTESGADGLPPGEGAFLPCSFWLVDAYVMQGRDEEAEAMFKRLLSLANDVGLFSEEYDPRAHRQTGNFPQAFSHLSMIGSALNMHEIGQAQRS